MKQLIKSATVYKAIIPVGADDLHAHLETRPFAELLPTQMLGRGFVPINAGGRMVETFPGGMAWRIRIDTKTIPAALIARRVDEMAAAIQTETGRKPGAKRRRELKEEVILELAPQAFPRTAAITCYYHTATNYLIVPTTSQKLADIAVTELIQALAAVKTETLHVASAKKGLTAKLKTWLDEPEADPPFGDFEPCQDVALAQDGRKITVKMGDLAQAHSGLTEALNGAFEVTSMGLCLKAGTVVRLTHDFKFKGIGYTFEDTEQDDELADPFSARAALEVDAMAAVVTSLLELLQYQEGDAPKAEPAAVTE